MTTSDELEQERARLWDAVIAVDAIEFRHSLENSGDLAERIERIGQALSAAKEFPVYRCEEWQCRYVFPDKWCCRLPLNHEGPHSAVPPRADEAPIPLTRTQIDAVETWASDDRLWGSRESTKVNLFTFARVILKLAEPAAPSPTGGVGQATPSLDAVARDLWRDDVSVLQAVLDAISGTLDPHTQIADHPNVKFAQMAVLRIHEAAYHAGYTARRTRERLP